MELEPIDKIRGFLEVINRFAQLMHVYECPICHMDGKWDLNINLDLNIAASAASRINMHCRHCDSLIPNPFLSLME